VPVALEGWRALLTIAAVQTALLSVVEWLVKLAAGCLLADQFPPGRRLQSTMGSNSYRLELVQRQALTKSPVLTLF